MPRRLLQGKPREQRRCGEKFRRVLSLGNLNKLETFLSALPIPRICGILKL